MFQPYVTEQAIDLVAETLRSGWIGEGPRVKEFEARLTSHFGFKYCVALNSGTAALRLALALGGVGPGDEVITPAFTCTATNMPILEQFATPIFADIQYETGNLDPLDIGHRVTERTKAIMVVHWAGYPADLEEINRVGLEHDLVVIEDAAHALGAVYHGRCIGTGPYSDFTMFSFQAIKQLTTGDGGLLTMRTPSDYNAARRRRWYGIDREYRLPRVDGLAYWPQTEVGYKYHMNDIAASIGLGNLEHVKRILADRRAMAKFYRDELADVAGVTLFEKKDGRISGNWLFTIHVERRDDFCCMMNSFGIDVSVCHTRNDMHPIFGPLRDDLPNTERFEKTNISIPIHNFLSQDDLERVVEAIRGGW
jgi:perosamine synthetase